MFARWLAASLGVCSLAPSVVLACGGGGLFSAGNVTGNVQRIVLSVRAGGTQTDVITQVEVKDTRNNYALLIPLPAEPTLDPLPVDSAELAILDARTRVTIERGSGSSGGGCGGGRKNKGATLGEPGGDVEVGEPVAIGPVTAVPLSADTGEPIVAWLEKNDFVLIEGAAEVIGEYAAPGRWFLAVKRNDTELGGATSVGVHFTLPGDHRQVSLPFSRFGAAEQISFVVFVAADRAVGPRAPFRALTLADLDLDLVEESYGGAIASAVAAEDGKAFVIEGVYEGTIQAALKGTRLVQMLDKGAVLTRLTGSFVRASLDSEVLFTGDAPDEVPTTLTVGAAAEDAAWPLDGRLPWLLFALVALAVLRARQTRRRSVARIPGLTRLGAFAWQSPASPVQNSDG